MGNFPIGLIGAEADLTYPYEHIGEGGDVLASMVSGKHAFAKVLKKATRPMLIVGTGALVRDDGAQILAAARKIADDTGMVGTGGSGDDQKSEWNGFNVLSTAAARVGGMELGFLPGSDGADTRTILERCASGAIKVLYLLGADECDTAKMGDAFVVYQGHHGDRGAHRADVILPGAAYTEKAATYVNTEGRVQRTQMAVQPPGNAREDWTIIRALSERLGKTVPFDDVGAVRAHMAAINPVFETLDRVTPAQWTVFGSDGAIGAGAFISNVDNFYMTDPISRVSVTMANCVAAASGEKGTGTDG